MRRAAAVLTLSALAFLVLVVSLAVFLIRDNPTRLPLEVVGLSDYTILDSDVGDYSGTSYEGMRGAALTVSTKKTVEGDLRSIARTIKADEDYEGYDFLEVGFTDRSAGYPVTGFAFVAISEKAERAIRSEKVSSGSRNDDSVYFFDVSEVER